MYYIQIDGKNRTLEFNCYIGKNHMAVYSFQNPLISREIVFILGLCTCSGNYGNFLLQFFDKNFVKTTFILLNALQKLQRSIELIVFSGNYGNFLFQFFDKNFVKTTLLRIRIVDLTKYFFGQSKFFIFPQSVKNLWFHEIFPRK